ncbi:DNA polymerase III subunit gamma/tau [Segnochrobactrum spirostomi]|uniref:DNA polymerase III subunit gamma/tau n=1 Tax=Segnochrobactrum spirostomi TaxID=2608987 RepID=A0A6A7Y3Y3_9HYPH|nr:DNA polymerase III subunit gamma/tau [Segnochrobactrum spirostomi]MQT12429.1 DNA polymerase III subunit gamma/tau [Segnochrobactrum spirostomi]
MHGDGSDLIGKEPRVPAPGAPADEPSFLPAEPAPKAAAATAPYRVLARKYRPRSFDDLIGQEPMVRTLSNAFESGRIPQAWMLTGVRGVGKTTTARILARALNYVVPGEIDRPTVKLPRLGLHCEAIMEGRHVDVIEMDAASHTSINDIREITEASRYKPVSARYKVYIVDEVHMLSTAAFNGLLKTLEEPPEHVKFVFATTEIRKVPVTVLSRCQRFDLRRIDADVLVTHLTRIAAAEGVTVDDEALALVARAAEGSVRDSLSLLDQAIAHGGGRVTGTDLRAMLGLADRARVIDLFEHVMRGDAAAALAELKAQYDVGADPAVVLTDLSAFVHLVTRLKLVPDAARDASLTEAERLRGADFAGRLPIPVLSRAWQLLLKGIAEVQGAARPLAAAEMVLIRLAYTADLPTPDEAMRLLRDGGDLSGRGGSGAPSGGNGGSGAGPRAALKVAAEGAGGSRPFAAAAPQAQAETARAAAGPALASLADIAELCSAKRDIRLKFAVERQMRLMRLEAGRIEFEPTPDAPPDLAGELGRKLSDWTGTRWIVTVTRGASTRTLHEERTEAAARSIDDARNDPLVAAVLARFPGASVVDVRINGEEPAAAVLAPVRERDEFDDDNASDGHDDLAFDADFNFDKL